MKRDFPREKKNKDLNEMAFVHLLQTLPCSVNLSPLGRDVDSNSDHR